MDHVGAGGAWDLHRKRDGLFILPPFVNTDNFSFYRGTVDAIKGALDYVRRAAQHYCILTGGHTIYNTTYERAMELHMERGADITMLYNIESHTGELSDDRFDDVRLVLNERGRVVDMEIDNMHPKSSNVSMDMMILDKSLLEYLIDEASTRGHSDFLRDVIFKKLDSLKVYGCVHEGYVARLHSVTDYFAQNMALLKDDVRKDLFNNEHPVYTKVKDEAPARYASTAVVKNSLVADGCVIEGEIENCILFRGVRVNRGAQLRNCIVMQATEIQENSVLENVILDKAVVVKRDRRLMGHETFPVIIRKNARV
jgi:glucose-1-phosphate adenylyltransferase